jgi:hypothetical protein
MFASSRRTSFWPRLLCVVIYRAFADAHSSLKKPVPVQHWVSRGYWSFWKLQYLWNSQKAHSWAKLRRLMYNKGVKRLVLAARTSEEKENKICKSTNTHIGYIGRRDRLAATWINLGILGDLVDIITSARLGCDQLSYRFSFGQGSSVAIS